ncbi:TnsA-like heteromeric transposase endonuclease subunit [Streptomyces sp. QL37]|uniref:TnsA-like heteromeric transposase endonuclease subunit n=1 Tax=Streptomyces sp. QL37 TaxID=2093747 RepID=UPI000CF2400D|nr:TnsA-like heteromeric transposase endonuclease subunit [Streptomyces sp. QL37]PPQ62048.1 hypothetical protein C5F59_39445 [Streptomyces sp. QL37]
MVKNLQIVHKDGSGREVAASVEQVAGVRLWDGAKAPVWTPLRHPSERSIVTHWWSATTGRFVGCRSLQRLSMAMQLDFHPNVVDLAAWTARLEWSERGRVRRFVPDFFTRTAGGATVVVACPPTAGPGARWERQREVLKQACEEAGWQFGSPQRPQPTALANMEWVSRYRHPRNADRDVEQALLAAFAVPRELMEGVSASGVPRLLALPRLYHLVWCRRLALDWSVALGPASVVRTGGRAKALRPFTVEGQK